MNSRFIVGNDNIFSIYTLTQCLYCVKSQLWMKKEIKGFQEEAFLEVL